MPMKLRIHIISLLLLYAYCGFSQVIHIDFQRGTPDNSFKAKTIDLPFISDTITAQVKNFELTSVASKELLSITNPPINSTPIWEMHYGTSKKHNLVAIQVRPYIKDESGEIKRIKWIEFDISANAKSKTLTGTYKTTNLSVLAQGNWYQWWINTTGVYKISYDDLVQANIDFSSVNSLDQIKIHGKRGKMLNQSNAASRIDDLPELAAKRVDNGNGFFDQGDYLLFYAEGPSSWNYDTASKSFSHEKNIYSDSTYLYLSFNNNSPANIASQAESGSSKTDDVFTYTHLQFREKDERNFLRSGRLWLGDAMLGGETKSFSFICPNLDQNQPTSIKSNLYAKCFSNSGSTFNLLANGNSVPSILIPYVTGGTNDDAIKSKTTNYSFNSTSDTIKVDVQYNSSSSSSEGFINYLEISARTALVYNDSLLNFRDPLSIGTGKVSKFHIAANTLPQLWDITDFFNPKSQSYTSTTDSLFFTIETDSLKEFILFNENKVLHPHFKNKIKNQNLHGLMPAELIIITHPILMKQALRLAKFHQNQDSLSVHVIDINDIFNEFSAGIHDVSAIRDFLKMLYDSETNGTDSLRYLLMFGDGTYDYKNIMSDNLNLVPTYQSVNSVRETQSYTSDDFFVFLDDNEGVWNSGDMDLPDAGVGRIPVKNEEEASKVVNKIFGYCNYFDTENMHLKDYQHELHKNWRNEIVVMGDDEDNNMHVNQANQIADNIISSTPQYNVNKIFLDAYKQILVTSGENYPTAKKALTERINDGVFLINYTGHGGEEGLSGEGILNSLDIMNLKNTLKYPLFVTATCEFSRYDIVNQTSAGERLLLNETGGAIALFSTVRLVFSQPNFNLNKTFYTVFNSELHNTNARMGDLFRETKTLSTLSKLNGENDRNFTFLGDPAVKLSIPQENIKLSTVVNLYENTPTDTIKSLMRIRISGTITDTAGNKLNQYNGIVYSTLFDKKQSYKTLLNNGGSTYFDFTSRDKRLFEGKSSVKNGDFTAEFCIPKDVASQYDYSKFSFYAVDSTFQDASGYNDSIIIGGTYAQAIKDEEGPKLDLFLNDSSFIYGSITNATPLLLVKAADSSGFNITSDNLGHQMNAVIDAKSANEIILTPYFETGLNNYQSGEIKYRLDELQSGRHSIEVKIYDSYNNQSRAYTEFIVSGNEALALSHVLNYPNPFTTSTGFYFEHNQPGRNLEVNIQIYSVSGKLIKTINEDIATLTQRVGPISWDGFDDFGDPIGKGVYIYQVKIKSEDGTTDHFYEKLVILK